MFAAPLPWALGLPKSPALAFCIMLKGFRGKPSQGSNYHSRYFTGGLTHALFGFGVAVNPRG